MTLARYNRQSDKLEIDRRLAKLAPHEDASSEEKEAFQVFINDVIRHTLKTEDATEYYKRNPDDLLKLLDIFTRGQYGVLNLASFRYFDVSKIEVSDEYLHLLQSILKSVNNESR